MNNMNYNYLDGRITIDPNLCNGKPTIRGKRITVQTIVEFLSAGETSENILARYPSLEKEDIQACLIFASKLMNHKFTQKELEKIMETNFKIKLIPNPNILASAKSFYKAAQIINKEDFQNRIIPCVVNSAFALELFLKSLNAEKIFSNGKPICDEKSGEQIDDAMSYDSVKDKALKNNRNGHNFVSLFQNLDKDIQSLIENNYRHSDKTFAEDIVEYKNIFIDWRYSFEGNTKGIEIKKLFQLLKTLDKTTSGLIKTD